MAEAPNLVVTRKPKKEQEGDKIHQGPTSGDLLPLSRAHLIMFSAPPKITLAAGDQALYMSLLEGYFIPNHNKSFLKNKKKINAT
jgi:hypothetical protein